MEHLAKCPWFGLEPDHVPQGRQIEADNGCVCLNVDPISYQPHHSENCVRCEDTSIAEDDLVKIIREDEVPVVKSVMDYEGKVTISITRMSVRVDYTAISHVWAGGLGNFGGNGLPQCQLQTIHQDVYNLSASSIKSGRADLLPNVSKSPKPPQRSEKWKCLRFRRKTTCYYWLDTLCIPVSHADERSRAINSMGRIYAGAARILVLDPILEKVYYNNLGDGDTRYERANSLISTSPWMARSWPALEAAFAVCIYVKFAEVMALYSHSHLRIAANISSISDQKENEERLSWYDGLRQDSSPVVDCDEELSYDSAADFVTTWNLLATRTTAFPEDVPAIFAALIHRSPGEVLAISPELRGRALLRSMDSLPLDILCVERDKSTNGAIPHTQDWSPRLPGSKTSVPKLNSRWGSLKRVSDGLMVIFNKSEPIYTRAVLCQPGTITPGSHNVREVGSQEIIQLHLNKPTTQLSSSDSQLLMLLPKENLQDFSYQTGILCSVVSETNGVLRVHFESTFSWSSAEGSDSNGGVVDCAPLDQSRRILIEMDFTHWPILTWSRFNQFPYQHLQAQQIDTTHVKTFFLLWSTLIPAFFAFFFSLLAFLDSHSTSPLLPEQWHLHIRPVFIGSIVGILPQWYFATKDGAFAASAMATRARYLWALTFWDTEKARRILSRYGSPVSLALFIRTLVPLAINIAIVCGVRNHAPKSVIFLGIMPGVITSVARVLFMLFLQAQWLVSTLPYRHYPVWMMPHLQLSGEVMRAHFRHGLFIVLAAAFAAACGAMSVLHMGILGDIWYGRVPNHSGLRVGIMFALGVALGIVLLLFWVVAGLGCVAFVVYQSWMVARDVARRVRLVYAQEGGIRLE